MSTCLLASLYLAIAAESSDGEVSPRTLIGPSRAVSQLRYSPDGQHLLGGSADQHVYVWDVNEGVLLRRLALSSEYDLVTSSDGWMIGAIGGYGQYHLCELETGHELIRGGGEGRVHLGTYSAAFAPELTRFALGARRGKIEIYDVAAGKLERSILAFDESRWARCVAFSDDGKRIAAVDDQAQRTGADTVDIWDATAGTKIRSLQGVLDVMERRAVRDHEFIRVHWLGDDYTIAAVDNNGRSHFWHIGSGTHVGHIAVSTPIDFSADGQYLAHVVKGQTTIVEIATARSCFTAPWPVAQQRPRDDPRARRTSPHRVRCTSIAIAPDLSSVAAARADDPSIHVWSLRPWGERQGGTGLSIAALWGKLAARDAAEAFAAMWRMADIPEESLNLLAAQLSPAVRTHVDLARIGELIEQLDDDGFEMRQRASESLVQMGNVVVQPVEAVLLGDPSAEVRARAKAILREIKRRQRHLPLEHVRRLRAITVLELIGSAEACTQLRRLSAGDSAARETRQARMALLRLSSCGGGGAIQGGN